MREIGRQKQRQTIRHRKKSTPKDRYRERDSNRQTEKYRQTRDTQ